MTKGKEVVERRQHKRFQVQDGAFAVLGPYATGIGPIIDVSMGGLKFSYVVGEEPLNGSFELGILLAEHSFYLTKIPFKTIWDEEVKDVPLGSLRMRRCGIRLGQLTDQQISQLEYFIQNHTVGEV